ncbi:MAG: glycosyltransferase family 4 protein [Patescibacteria group bacterium]
MEISQKPLTILACPAHYQMDDEKKSSEYLWTFRILRSLVEDHGFRVIALTGMNYTHWDHPHWKVESLFDREVPAPTMRDKLYFMRAYLRRAKQLMHSERIDLLFHVLPFGFQETFNPLSWSSVRGRRSLLIGPVQSPHAVLGDDVSEGPSRSMLSPLFRALSRKTLLAATAVTAVNEHARQTYQQWIPGLPVHVIPPGIDLHQYPWSEPPKHDSIRFMTAGTLMKRKAVDVLLRAFARVVQEVPDSHLTIVGDGPQRPALEALSGDLKIAHAVTFTGQIPQREMTAQFRACDILCSATQSETFGQIYLEAMAVGRPVITTSNIGSREIVKDGETGFLVPVGDLKALSMRMIQCAKDLQLRKQLGAAGRKRAEEIYAWPLVGRQYAQLISKLIS